MLKKSKKTFDYSKTQWGISEIENYKSNFQGYEIELLINGLKNKTKNKLKVLDLGCGGGNVDGFLKKKFPHWDITGIDVSVEALKVARKNFPGVKFVNSSVDNLNYKPKSFDVILSLDTMEHFDNPDNVVRSIFKILKDDGLCYLAVPLEKQFPTFYWFMYKMGLDKAKRASVGHINVLDNKEVTRLFKDAGFTKEHQYFGGHLIYTLLDFACFWMLHTDKSEKPSFESSLNLMKPGLKKTLALGLKKLGASLIYFENKILSGIPAGRGHYFFRKSEFFSINPPVTVCEDLQIKNGLSKVVRPKDIFIINHLKNWRFDKNTKILDFGTANGLWLERILKSKKSKGVGVDVSKDLIEAAIKRKNVLGQYFLTGDTWPLKNNYFDYCVSFDVFEHVKDRDLEIKRIFNSMKKGGKFLFYTLNPDNKYTFDWLFEKFGSNYLYDRADHDKKLFLNPVKFKKSLENVGFFDVNYSLYDGPFNLFWDVFAYALLSVFPSRSVFNINDKVVKFVYPVNLILDLLFNKQGYSNGYFIWGQK
jgi:2-polyprenyl-3-methyl-5-hydroxy-6-metoxy-1,4-benzoquinol methylase